MKSRKLLMVVMVLVGFSFALAAPSWAGDSHRSSYKSCDKDRGGDRHPDYRHDSWNDRGGHYGRYQGRHHGWYRHPAPPRVHHSQRVVVKEVHRYKVVERSPRHDEHFHLSASAWEPGFGFRVGVGGSR